MKMLGTLSQNFYDNSSVYQAFHNCEITIVNEGNVFKIPINFITASSLNGNADRSRSRVVFSRRVSTEKVLV